MLRILDFHLVVSWQKIPLRLSFGESPEALAKGEVLLTWKD